MGIILVNARRLLLSDTFTFVCKFHLPSYSSSLSQAKTNGDLSNALAIIWTATLAGVGGFIKMHEITPGKFVSHPTGTIFNYF